MQAKSSLIPDLKELKGLLYTDESRDSINKAATC